MFSTDFKVYQKDNKSGMVILLGFHTDFLYGILKSDYYETEYSIKIDGVLLEDLINVDCFMKDSDNPIYVETKTYIDLVARNRPNPGSIAEITLKIRWRPSDAEQPRVMEFTDLWELGPGDYWDPKDRGRKRFMKDEYQELLTPGVK